ncbi:hypothetical protein C1903_03930 [Listeria ivanovii]|uniref:hypothetical protein n=1 Tax=Listeria ivanovii TaxID=1638 RepID=UPI000DA8CE1F|nr:hypothetical protein [Listeria ivanovii]PZF90316.1 hypothetical protein C1905_03445 [Listeria ivanovii]PZF95789.1 hypothetical protein C1903_03930 [Listeria ivanovii]PZG06065.1 hypothetical protein C2L88_03925 [Listeria ivanovii]PZG10903.1 hypothetical protein C1901_03925 [Listeria ivanovii]PZG27832.1 hypothetical protein C1900_03450 [Listeria ivanovii]
MKAAISINDQKFYTDMKKAFEAIQNKQANYNWLISNFECNCYPAGIPEQEYIWITGEELTKVIAANDIQFIWGVFSGFKKNISLEEILESELPIADGYAGFWKEAISIQHKLASIEIVPWDSTLVLFISKAEELTTLFKENFPNSKDLAEYNGNRTK